MLSWLGHVLGLTSASGTPYLAWSGVVGDGGLAGGLLLNAWLFARKHNCHEHRCPRLGRFPADGGWHYCQRHRRPPAPQPPDPVAAAVRKLSGDISDLAQAIRESLAAGRGAA
jgi:hypothetical protein